MGKKPERALARPVYSLSITCFPILNKPSFK
ncbi:MAG: hypothetical protein JWR15_3851 [Prosthecobacter sp.]|nr:hypothetical protein [Prosthecobacter sp.]